jgi:predicted type IV restriction endonuclease
MNDKFEFLKSFKNKDQRDLREADVRYQIIDNVFKNILSWPDDKVKCEDYVHSGFIDYTLYNKNSTPFLLIEAKREGKYFELPQNSNKNELRRSINTEELLSNEEINKAIFQVKSYAEDLGCNYVCITNGHEWIITHINPQNKPWKKQPSIVISKID